jgi:hypothetical protein
MIVSGTRGRRWRREPNANGVLDTTEHQRKWFSHGRTEESEARSNHGLEDGERDTDVQC